MRIYLASSFADRDRLNGYKLALQSEGHTITSRWLNRSHETSMDDEAIEENLRFAAEDYSDVLVAQALIHFEPEAWYARSHGERHIELGMALALDKLVIHVGARENAFHYLPGVQVVPSFAAALAYLRWYEARIPRLDRAGAY